MTETTAAPAAAIADGEWFDIPLGDDVLRARRPKEVLIGRAFGVFHDKYAPDHVVAKTAFDFFTACFDVRSNTIIQNRMLDQDDDFDTAAFLDLFERVLEALADGLEDDVEPANREARRAAARTPAKRTPAAARR